MVAEKIGVCFTARAHLWQFSENFCAPGWAQAGLSAAKRNEARHLQLGADMLHEQTETDVWTVWRQGAQLQGWQGVGVSRRLFITIINLGSRHRLLLLRKRSSCVRSR